MTDPIHPFIARQTRLTVEAAREALLFHSGQHPNVFDHRWTYGFLGSLRPFRGLREENFHEVMECLRVLAPTLADQLVVDGRVVSSVWGLCHLGRMWGVHPEGMLRRNGLISNEDVSRLEEWINTISYAFMCVLDGAVEEAFHHYDQLTSTANMRNP